MVQLRRDHGCNGFADHLMRCVSKYGFGSGIPAGDDAIQILADDGVFGRFDDCGQESAGLFCFLYPLFDFYSFGDLKRMNENAIDAACTIPQWLINKIEVGFVRLAASSTIQNRFHLRADVWNAGSVNGIQETEERLRLNF